MKHESRIWKKIKAYALKKRVSEDAHGFERESEGDLFLYEAMEGLEKMHLADAQQALDELEVRLAKSEKNKVAVPWLRIAAGLAIVLGGSAVWFMLQERAPTAPTVNQEPIETETLQPIEEALIPFDSISGDTTEPVAFADSVAMRPNLAPALRGMDGKTKREERKPKVAPVEEDLETDEVFAMADSEDQQVEDIAEMDGAAEDAKQPVVVDERIQQAAPQQMNEVKAISKLSREATAKSSAPVQAQPMGGMAAYKSYLKSNLKKTQEMKSGSVVISFEFDRNGKPRKLEVERSLCEACDAEAIRLIENGVGWIVDDRKQRTQVTVTIP